MFHKYVLRNAVISGIAIFLALLIVHYIGHQFKSYKELIFVWVVVFTPLFLINYVTLKSIIKPLNHFFSTVLKLVPTVNEKQITDEEETLDKKLAKSVHFLTNQLQQDFAKIVQQRNELESLLAAMVEGMIAVDNDGYLIRVNRAARELFSIQENEVKGKLLIEVIRNSDLQQIVDRVLSKNQTIEEKITINKINRTLQVNGYPLYDADGRKFGALIVLYDITRLEKLERIRSEFVSNVSHELKTPITSIRGYVETLKENEITDKETLIKFLNIILKHAERLSIIIEDLLNLSRIEREGSEIKKEEIDIIPILLNVVDEYHIAITQNQLELQLKLPEKLICLGNQQLLHQAFSNLLDNAIKYAAEGKRLIIEAKSDENGIVISFQDFGPGIDEKHHERIFERFYRVDVGRSRALGGSGLGLAIVKHIILAHQGTVTLKSELGRGATFQIHLPHPNKNQLST